MNFIHFTKFAKLNEKLIIHDIVKICIKYVYISILILLKPCCSTQVSDPVVLNAEALNSAVTHADLQLVLTRWPALHLSSVVDHMDNTLLHEAAYSGRRALVEMLVERVDVNSRNDFGRTPLHFAHAGHHWEIAELLIAHGALSDSEQEVRNGGKEKEKGVKEEEEEEEEEEGSEERSWVVGEEKDWVCHDTDCGMDGREQASVWWKRYLASGWIDQDPINSAWAGVGGCQIAVRSHLSPEEFESQYFSQYRPVVLRGMMADWPAWEHWTKPVLLKRYIHF